MSVVTASAQHFFHPLQFIEETVAGITPTTGSTTAVGAGSNLDVTMNGNYVEVTQVGPEDLYGLGQGLTSWESSMQYQCTDSAFLKRGINAANIATPTGTISANMAVMYSIYLNGVVNYIVLNGTKAKSVTYTKEIGKVDVAQFSLIHTNVALPTATPPTGLTLVTAFPSGELFGWLTGGANPMSWNAVAQLCKKITFTVERNATADFTLGNAAAHSVSTHGRRIKGSFTVLWTSTTLETDYKNGTARTLALVNKTAVSTTTITGAKITSYKRSKSADDNEAILEECDFSAVGISVT